MSGNILVMAAAGAAALTLAAGAAQSDGDMTARGEKAGLRYTGIRRAFLRGEDAVLDLDALAPADAPVENGIVSVDVGGLVREQTTIGRIEPGGVRPVRITVPTRLLKAGEYAIWGELTDGAQRLDTLRMAIWVAARPNPDRMRVWLWPHTKFGVNVEKLDDMCRRQLAWYAAIGVNSFQPYGELNRDKFEVFDYALVNGWEMGVRLSGALRDDFGGLSPEARYTVARENVVNDPYHPEVIRLQNETNDQIMRIARQFPCVKTSFFNSEIEDILLGHETPMARLIHRPNMGPTVPHSFVGPGVIADNDDGYVERRYNMLWGDGLTEANARAAEVAHRHDSNHVVFTDPHRRFSAYGRFREMDLISTWTYTNPDPKYMLYIETLIASAKPTGQGVMHTVTLLNYPGTIFPKDRGWSLMGPDRLVETSWINLSRRPDGLAIYLSSSCDPFDSEEGARGDFDQDPRIPVQANPPTFEAFAEFTREVVQPYGPMIKKLERTPRRTALLSSQSSRVYSDSPNLLGYYGPYHVYSFYTLLQMAHIPADIVFDETIAVDGLDGYDVLALPKCDTLTETVFNAICEFQRRGGQVIGDQYLRAPIPDVTQFDFDFTYRSRISANAILESKDYAHWDDRIDVETADMTELEGVSAGVDQQAMEAYAARLRGKLDGLVTREVHCSSPTALLNMLQSGEAKYLFVINDKRTYGERVGEYRAMLDEAVPQTVTISLNQWAHEKLYVYDMLERRQIDCRRGDGSYTFDVDLPAPGGKIIALLPQELAAVEISAPARISTRGVPCRIDILVRDADRRLMAGVQPLGVEILDPHGNRSEFSDYYAAEAGLLSLDFIPALNDRAGMWSVQVKDLIAGLQARTSFELAE